MDTTAILREAAKILANHSPFSLHMCTLYVIAAFQVVQIIARITPTKKDDEIVSKFWKILNFIFLKSRVK